MKVLFYRKDLSLCKRYSFNNGEAQELSVHKHWEDLKLMTSLPNGNILVIGARHAQIFRPSKDEMLGELLFISSRRWWTQWDVITPLPFGNVLFYNRKKNHSEIFKMNENGTLAELISSHDRWRGWEIITLLSEDIVLFYGKGKARSTIYRLNEKAQLVEQLESHNDWDGWDAIVPLPGNLLLFYSKEGKQYGRIFETNGKGKLEKVVFQAQLGPWDFICPIHPSNPCAPPSSSNKNPSSPPSSSPISECVVCLEEPEKFSAFVPCGHVACCQNCASTLLKCPICCKKVESALPLFFS